jgi:hypothetical protein
MICAKPLHKRIQLSRMRISLPEFARKKCKRLATSFGMTLAIMERLA